MPDPCNPTSVIHSHGDFHHGLLTREKHLYRDIKHQIRTKTRAVQFAKSLEEQSHRYAGLLNPHGKTWRRYSPAVKNRIAALNMMRVEQVRPLLIGVLAKFTEGQAVKALRLIVAGVVRVLVAGVRGGTYEKLYATLAKNIHDGGIKNERSLRAAMAKAFPGDEQFQQAFASASVSKGYLARFYLRELEQYSNLDRPEWIPSDSDDDVSLEHILPKNHDSNKWPDYTDELHRAYRYRLGNQVLLAASDNSVNADDAYSEKRPSLTTSTFAITQMASKHTEWTPDTINAHQLELAKLALKVWPLSGEIVKSTGAANRLTKRRAASSETSSTPKRKTAKKKSKAKKGARR